MHCLSLNNLGNEYDERRDAFERGFELDACDCWSYGFSNCAVNRRSVAHITHCLVYRNPPENLLKRNTNGWEERFGWFRKFSVECACYELWSVCFGISWLPHAFHFSLLVIVLSLVYQRSSFQHILSTYQLTIENYTKFSLSISMYIVQYHIESVVGIDMVKRWARHAVHYGAFIVYIFGKNSK